MEVLEALSKYRQELKDTDTPEVYVRPDKEQELDVLWQNFKTGQKSEKSPGIYLSTGFIAGVIVTLVITGAISLFSGNNKSPYEDSVVETSQIEVQEPIKEKKRFFGFGSNKQEKTVNSAENSEPTTVENKLYQIKNGDTMSKILIQFYGNASKENEEKVLKVNNMSNPNKLTAGEKIIIPVDVEQ